MTAKAAAKLLLCVAALLLTAGCGGNGGTFDTYQEDGYTLRNARLAS